MPQMPLPSAKTVRPPTKTRRRPAPAIRPAGTAVAAKAVANAVIPRRGGARGSAEVGANRGEDALAPETSSETRKTPTALSTKAAPVEARPRDRIVWSYWPRPLLSAFGRARANVPLARATIVSLP